MRRTQTKDINFNSASEDRQDPLQLHPRRTRDAGDKIHRNIYDPQYYKVVEATPNSSRFDTNTELTVING